MILQGNWITLTLLRHFFFFLKKQIRVLRLTINLKQKMENEEQKQKQNLTQVSAVTSFRSHALRSN